MKNKSEDLRNHLFATLEALQDKEKPMEIERARAIADVAQVVVNLAKAEVAFANATGSNPDRLPFFSDVPSFAEPGEKMVANNQPRIVHKIK
ncbi:MAG: hypothetical protein ACK5X0_18675 [Rhodospirillales bacterium]|jgi:hypothetical protein